ncbi:hypothetical protein BD769DRAFT_1663695 [Suillus cothurnatus]|nr:hypothetical protein BD769DRAFT_1663695 [Suillus cothurnatus]
MHNKNDATKAEKQADDDCLAAAREQKEADALAGLTRLAEMHGQMEAMQAQAAEKPKAVKPQPVPKGHQACTSQSEEPFSKQVTNTTEHSTLLEELYLDATTQHSTWPEESGFDATIFDTNLSHVQHKRKQLAEVIKFSESEISEFLDEDDEIMDIDGSDDESDADIKPKSMSTQARHTTASTSVTTTTCKAPLPPSKKVKLEKNAKLKGNIKSEERSTALPDLPPGCHEDGKWVQVFLLTVLSACKGIFKAVYPDICYSPTMSGSVLVLSCNMFGEWHSNFGSMVLAITIDFCASNQDSTPTELLNLLLAQYAFLYPNPDNIDKSKTFHSAFVQELLATAHLSQIIGHADIPALDTV